MSAIDPQSQIRLCERTRRLVVKLSASTGLPVGPGVACPTQKACGRDRRCYFGDMAVCLPRPPASRFSVPLLLRPVLSIASITLNRCHYRVLRATFFSLAALVVTFDYWLFGVLAGLKWVKWELFMIDVGLAITAIVLVLIQLPSPGELKTNDSVLQIDRRRSEM